MIAALSTVLFAADPPLATPQIDWSSIAPNLVLMLGGVLLLTVVSIVRGKLPPWFHAVWTIAVATGALCAIVPLWQRVQDEGAESVMAGAVGLDGFGLFITGTICVSVILGALLLEGYVRREGLEGSEWYVLMLLSASGAVTMATANDLIVLFIGLEIMSVAVYVLAAMHSKRISSQEAGMKYFVLGAFWSAFLLYGIALTYGATGSTNLVKIQAYLSDNVITSNGLLLGGIAFMLVGFGFKVAAAPFHFWTPDVYQGAPSPVTAFMSTAVKAAAFAGLFRVFVVALGPTYRDEWRPMIYVLTVLTLVVGSLLAISQTNVKRMLAYSSINHAGFLLLGVMAASPEGNAATLFYLIAYTFMAAGSFAVVTVVGRTGDGHHSIEDYKGLSSSRPGLALVFTILLLSQAGVPLTAGFLAKFYVLAAAVQSEFEGWQFLTVLAMITAVISAFMYLRLVGTMYFGDAGTEAAGPRLRIPAAAGVALGIAVIGVLFLGIVPGPITQVTNDAVATLVAFTR